MSRCLIGKRGSRRCIYWGRLLGRVPWIVLFAVILCLAVTGFLIPVTPLALQVWWAERVGTILLVSIGAGLALGIVRPVVCGLRRPLDELVDLDTPAEEEAESVAAWLHTWRHLFACLAFVALVSLWYVEENWRGRQLWEEYARESAARGEVVNPAALVPPPVPDGENFAMTPFLASLFGVLPAPTIGTKPPQTAWSFGAKYKSVSAALGSAKKTPKIERSNSWFTARMDLRAWSAGFDKWEHPGHASDTNVVSTDLAIVEAATNVLAALADCDPVLDELRAASRRPYSRFKLDYASENPATILLPHLAALKGVCQVLQLRASAELALGRTDAAFDDLNLMFVLVDSLRGEPILISHLVRLAEFNIALQPLIEGLADRRWSEPQLRALETRLRRFDFCVDAKRTLEGERVLFGSREIDLICRSPNRYRIYASFGMRGGTIPGTSTSYDFQAALLAAIPSGWLYLERLNHSRFFQEYLLGALDLPDGRIQPDAVREAERRSQAFFKQPWPAQVLEHRFFCGLLLPALGRTIDRTAFAQEAANLASVACALERHRLARGQWPQSLDALVPGFVNQLPEDIINGQQLRYRRTDDGQYLLYSIGWNGTDEGGVLGLSQNGESVDRQKGDWVWRLPAER